MTVLDVLGVILTLLGLGTLGWSRLSRPAKGPLIERSNTVDPDRTVPIGVPDSQGYTQAPVHELDEDELDILPDGVDGGDVHQVVVIKPDVSTVKVRDKSRVSAKQVGDLLKKYGP